MNYDVHNTSSHPFTGYLDDRLVRKKVPAPNKGIFHIKAFYWAAYSTPVHPFEKLTFEDMEKADLNQEVKSGWLRCCNFIF